MRYVIYGAGGIGGTIGARLFQKEHDVLLIARGAHLEALKGAGLTFRTPDETVTRRIASLSGSPCGSTRPRSSDSTIPTLTVRTGERTVVTDPARRPGPRLTDTRDAL